MNEIKVEIGVEVPAWTYHECDGCGCAYPISRTSVKVVTESDLLCPECNLAAKISKKDDQLFAARDEIEKLSPLVEIVSNQKQSVQQLEEKLTKAKAEIAEYRNVLFGISKLASKQGIDCSYLDGLLAKHKVE